MAHMITKSESGIKCKACNDTGKVKGVYCRCEAGQKALQREKK